MTPRPRHNGVLLPNQRPNPARVLNASSKKRPEQKTINLTHLFNSPMPRICIVRRLGGIGDVLMSTPLLKAIKTYIPHCELTYATDLNYSNGALAEVIRHNPYVDVLISFADAAKETYDYSIDITATGLAREKPGTLPPNRIDMFAEAVGIDVAMDPQPIYVVTPEEREEALEYIETILAGRKRDEVEIIAIQVRSNDPRRTWPEVEVQKLIDLLAEDKKKHILICDWGGFTDKWEMEKDRVSTVFNMRQDKYGAILEQVDCVVCPDSSVLHLAGALDKKTVTIFGPIPAQCRINHYPNATALQLKLPCSGCFYTPKCMKIENKTQHLKCMKDITAEMVKEAVNKKLKEPLKIRSYIMYGSTLSSKNQDPIVLIKRASNGIGDLLMATPGIEAAKKAYPGKEIHVAVQKDLMPILEHNPYIDKVLDIGSPINLKRYYILIDISSPCAKYESSRVRVGKRVEKSRVEIFSEAMGTREYLTSLTPSYYVSAEEKEFAKKFLNRNADLNKPTVAFAMKSAEEYRNWPKENYKELFELLKDKVNIIIIDNKRDYDYEGTIDACGFSIRKSAAIISECNYLVTPDTGFLHFAAALEIPTIALFGPIDYKARCKGYKNITVIKSECEHMPCWKNAAIKCKKTGEVKGYSKCMKDIPTELVYQTLHKNLEVE